MISVATRMLLFYSLFILMNSSFAETQKTINYENQREEIFDLENFLKATRYRQEEVDSTCVRQIPYSQNVCRNETQYREECRVIPGHQECRTVNQQICHTEPGRQNCQIVVRYRQECSQGGGGSRQCRTVPPQVRCRKTPRGENRCEKIPGGQVCTNVPSQPVCRRVAYQVRECSQQPARQVCENYPRQQCDWIPSQRYCENIPYQIPVCRDEILYRQESYACKKTIDVPYEVTLTTHKANVQMNFTNNSASVTPQFTVLLNNNGALSISGKNAGAGKAAAFVKKELKNTENAGVNSINALYTVSVLDRDELFSFMDKGLSNLELKKTSLTFYVNGKFDLKRASLTVRISKNDDLKFNKVLNFNQIESEFDGIGTKVSIDLEKFGAPKLGGVFSKKHQVSLKLVLDYNDMGEIIVPEVGELSATLEQEVKVN